MKSKNTCQSFKGKNSFAALSDRIAEWLEANVRGAGMKGAVLGLSGGVDSAVAAALCRKAFGPHMMGIIMPCESVIADEQDAMLVAKTLGIKVITVRLDKTFRTLLEVLPKASSYVRANLKPRLRMAVLYYWANKLSYMVIGTGNRSELMTGYFTKHGDGGVDLLPLGSIYKGEVLKLAMELDVPERIIAKPPSAGLWMGQTDESEMGITYNELDGALRAIERGETEADSLTAQVQAMKCSSNHKRNIPPSFEVIR